MNMYSYAALLLMIVSFAYAGQKVCPGYGFIRPPDNCKSTCSMENDECPAGKKCCFRVEQPCGFQCIVPKDNTPKSGSCPASGSSMEDPLWGLCDGHMCDVDSDCQGVKKCCPNMCGSTICVAPAKP